MYLSEIYAENFRIFGKDGDALRLRLQNGLNALVGENDSGKTAIIDAVRYCLWTTSQDYHRFTEDDFHSSATGRATELIIRCKFENLSMEDQGTFLEFLTTPEGQPPCLYITLQARRLDNKRSSRISVFTHSGESGDGPAIEGSVREMLRTTYLRPLRDAEAELSAGRHSRLSQILSNHPEIADQARDDFDEAADTATTLVGIMRRAEHHLGQNAAIAGARDSINTDYLSSFKIGGDELVSTVGVSNDATLSKILEKLELKLASAGGASEWTRRGLGYNNALFMAAELLLLGSREVYPMLLIEEPEAHLHPQLQARVIELLNSKSSDTARPVQVLLTTHSPNLASSIPLHRVTVVCQGKTYSLAPSETSLSAGDYAFLQRFLDVTKSNLFFAKAVAIVEGDAEGLLLPAIAAKVGRPFGDYGVSVVIVGHTGVMRYSNIFKRADGSSIPLQVASLRDRDIVPDATSADLKGELKAESDLTPEEHTALLNDMRSSDGGSVKTFVSDRWTFEFDLACKSWKMARIMHQAVQSAKKAKSTWPTAAEVTATQTEAAATVDGWLAQNRTLEEAALQIYAPLKRNQASKAITAQFAASLVENSDIQDPDLPDYLVAALKHLVGEA